MKNSKAVLTIVAVAILGLAASAQATLLLYEPFDYTADTPLTGQGNTGMGMTGTWTGDVTGADGTAYVLGALSGQVWDGTLPGSTLPTAGGFAGGKEPPNVDHVWGNRPMDSSVTATFTDGSVTWMSAVFSVSANTAHRKPILAIGSGALAGDSNRGQTAAGEAIGGGALHNDSGGQVRALYWDDENGDAVDERHNSGEVTKKTPQEIFVAKIEWGAATDTVTVYTFAADGSEALTEAVFDAATKQTITSLTNLDQSQFNTLSFAGSRFFIDEIRIGTTFNDVVTGTSVGKSPIASNPDPADEATDVCRQVVLAWTAGEYADKHDVYFGTDFNDVNDANRDNPLDVLVKQNHDADSYAIGETLDFGQTYYWRIDEVNALPDATIYKGKTWSFTTEPIGYPIANVTATASSEYDPTRGPENTVNASGLVNDLHSNVMADMWLSDSEAAGAWIEYAFDRLYKLHEMWVWNFNDEFNNAYGLKGVTIEYSADGDDWTELAGVPEFAQAAGSPDYAHVTTIDFSGVTARYVKITANTNWGETDQYGLSEVRFLYIPVRAREPYSPPSGTDVPLDVTLSWTAGREAARHDVYLGTDEQAVADGTISPVSIPAADGCVAGYAPLSLELGKTYYWKVNEVNEAETPTTWESDILSFTTPEYLVVDDMESYGDGLTPGERGNCIFFVWRDGWTLNEAHGFPPGFLSNNTGASIGNWDPPFAETTIVSGGGQSMPYFYDNDGEVHGGNNPANPANPDNPLEYYSKGKAEISDLQPLTQIGPDWTVAGAKALSLQFYGTTGNAIESMWVELIDGAGGNEMVTYGDYADENPADINEASWHQWNIDLQDFADGGVDLTDVSSIAIGFGTVGATEPGGSGMVYFDDIRLYPSRCVLSKRSADFALVDFAPEGDPGGDCVVNYKELDVMTRDWLLGDASVEPVEPNAEGLMVRYEFENNANDSSGKGNNGTEFGYPVYTAGHDGSALQFDATDDYVNINDYKGILGSEPFSVTAWINTTAAGDRTIASWGTNTNGQKVDFRLQNGLVRIEHGSGNRVTYGTVNDGEWHHVAVAVIENASISYPDVTHYIDGQDDTRPGTDSDKFGTVADIDVSIGRRCLNNDRFFEGLIDDVRIYDYALSQGEIVGAAGEGTLYIPLLSPAEIYDSEPVNQKKVNFKDYARLTDNWLDEVLWP